MTGVLEVILSLLFKPAPISGATWMPRCSFGVRAGKESSRLASREISAYETAPPPEDPHPCPSPAPTAPPSPGEGSGWCCLAVPPLLPVWGVRRGREKRAGVMRVAIRPERAPA